MKSAIVCPTCGHAGMKRVRRTVESRVGKLRVAVPNVSLEECPRCGARLYDLAALAKIRRARADSGQHCVA